MFTTERIFERKNKKEEYDHYSDNISFSSNNSFYEKLDVQTKRDIIFLIKSGYDKKMIIKLYIFLKPSNIEEAVNYLTKENGVYQHIFYNSDNDDEFCEICGENKDMHINGSVSISFNSIDFNVSSKIENQANQVYIINVKNKAESEFKCKICEDDISEEEKIKNKCEQCGSYFCSECLYSYIKELIRNGKYSLFCPECSFVYTNDKIDQILSFNMKNKTEINTVYLK